MSYKNPNCAEILALVEDKKDMEKHFCKNYLQLAKREFSLSNGRKATLDDYQVLYDLYVNQWIDYYILKPQRVKENRELGRPIWQIGCKYGIDVYTCMCRFIEVCFSKFVEKPEFSSTHYNIYFKKKGYIVTSCAEIMKQKGYEFPESLIIEEGLLDNWNKFVSENWETLPKYHKRAWVDYSSMAYNGVANDF